MISDFDASGCSAVWPCRRRRSAIRPAKPTSTTRRRSAAPSAAPPTPRRKALKRRNCSTTEPCWERGSAKCVSSRRTRRAEPSDHATNTGLRARLPRRAERRPWRVPDEVRHGQEPPRMRSGKCVPRGQARRRPLTDKARSWGRGDQARARSDSAGDLRRREEALADRTGHLQTKCGPSKSKYHRCFGKCVSQNAKS